MKPLLVFDLDGTLVDSRADLVVSANEMLGMYNAGPLKDDAVAGFVGDGARMLVARSIVAAGVPATDLNEALATFLEIYHRRLLETTTPYPGIPEILERATRNGIAMGIVTNKPVKPTFTILHHFGLAQHFTWVVGGDGEFARKPDPASLTWMIAEAGADASSTLFIGDSQIDADTARAARAQFCLAAYGFGQARGIVSLQPGEYYAKSADGVARAIAAVAAIDTGGSV